MLKEELKTKCWLFFISLFISTFTFGGGYVVVPMIRRYYVMKKRLFTEETLIQMAAVAQSSPGAIAINLSALSGYQVAGFSGAVISCIATVIPPFIILSVVSAFYTAFITNAAVAAVLKGMQAGVTALMIDMIIDMCRVIIKDRSVLLTAMIPGAFIANFVFNINVALILLICCLLCAARVYVKRRTVQ